MKDIIYRNKNYSTRNFLDLAVQMFYPLEEKAIIIDCNPFWSLVNGEVIGNAFLNKTNSKSFFFKIDENNTITKVDLKKVNEGSPVVNTSEILIYSFLNKKLVQYNTDFAILRELSINEYPRYSDQLNFYVVESVPDEGSYTLKKMSINGELIWETTNSFDGIFIGLNSDSLLFNGKNFWDKLDARNESIISLSQINGEILWEKFVPDLIKNPVLIADDRVIVESQTLGVVCLDLKTGEILWTFKRLSFQYCRKYTLDYNEVLHLIEVDTYYQIDIKDGSIIREYSLANHYKQLKLKQALSNSGNDNFHNFFGSFSFFPTVTEDHFIIALFSNILFLNKNSGTLDYHYALPEKNSIVHELAVIDNNRILIRNNVFSGKMKGNIMRILESKR